MAGDHGPDHHRLSAWVVGNAAAALFTALDPERLRRDRQHVQSRERLDWSRSNMKPTEAALATSSECTCSSSSSVRRRASTSSQIARAPSKPRPTCPDLRASASGRTATSRCSSISRGLRGRRVLHQRSDLRTGILHPACDEPGAGRWLLGPQCACFDFDGDNDNDLEDFAGFQLSVVE